MLLRTTGMANDDGPSKEPLDPRVYFAAERTLLAWIRTGLALMGFGFVVARFGIFLRELAAVPGAPPRHGPGFSLWVGTTLVVCGVATHLWAAAIHWSTVRRLQRGEPLPMTPWSLGMAVAALLAVVGVVMAIYLMIGLGSEG